MWAVFNLPLSGLDKTQTPPIRTAKSSFDHYSVAVLTPSCCNHQSNGPNGARTVSVAVVIVFHSAPMGVLYIQ